MDQVLEHAIHNLPLNQMHLEETVEVNAQGQITLPASIRQILRGDRLRLVVEDDVVRLETQTELAGSLKHYAECYVPLEIIRERIWGENDNENHSGG